MSEKVKEETKGIPMYVHQVDYDVILKILSNVTEVNRLYTYSMPNKAEKYADNGFDMINTINGYIGTDESWRIESNYNQVVRIEEGKIKVGDWVKQSHGGYYQIIKRTSDYIVIKQAFDHKFVYAKQSANVYGFAIELTDLKTYQFVEKEDLRTIKSFFANNPDEEANFLRYTDTMLSLREEILKANFKEAEWEFRQFGFYLCTLEKVAFIVNLKDYGDHIGVTYGFTSIVDQDHLRHYGEDNSDIKIRFHSVIKTDEDKIAVASEIKRVYDTYLNRSKDEILSLKKERQKQFLQKIAEKLKPLGFKKKGAKWTRFLDSEFCLEFEAQKSH